VQTRRLLLAGLGVGAGAVALQRLALAEMGPPAASRIVVGFPPGGPLDIAARLVAPILSERLGRPFAVQNLPGSSGNLATAEVVRAEPDGRTLLLCGPVHAINSSLFEALPFDFGRDIAPIGGIARVPLVIEVHPSVPARSLAELIRFAQANPGQLKVAHAGNGTPQHIAIEMFRFLTGLDLAILPHQGSAPALAELVAGRVHAMFDPIPSSAALLREGRLVALATTGPARSPLLPEVPTASELLPGYEAGSWFGLGAPRGTPAELVETLAAALTDGLASPGMEDRLASLGATPMPLAPAAFRAFIATETARYAEAIRRAGIRRS